MQGEIRAENLNGTTIHVLNVSQNRGTTSTASGTFEIQVKEFDTLIFSSVQYQKKLVVISEAIIKDKFYLVNLTEAVNELKQIDLSNINLTGRLGNDLENIKTFNKYDLGVPLNKKPLLTQAERRLYYKSPSIGLTSAVIPLDMAINALSGRLARLKLVKAHEDLSVLVNKGMAAFPEEFFTTTLNIPQEEIMVFMYFCAEGGKLKEYIAEDKKLELLEFFRVMAPKFKLHREINN